MHYVVNEHGRQMIPIWARKIILCVLAWNGVSGADIDKMLAEGLADYLIIHYLCLRQIVVLSLIQV